MGIEPNEGAVLLLQYKLGKLPYPVGGWQLLLYKSALTLSQDTVYADLVECDFGGYLRVTLTPSLWTTPVIVADHVESTYGTSPLSWTSTGGPTNTIFGWAIVDAAASKIMFVEELDSCDQFTINPTAIFQLLVTISEGTRGCP